MEVSFYTIFCIVGADESAQAWAAHAGMDAGNGAQAWE